MSEAALIFSTAPDAATAEALAKRLIEMRLAACVQLSPIRSVYRWQGAVESDEEVLLLIKTRATCFEAIAALWRTAHPYETPELVMTPLSAVAPAYGAWLLAETDAL